MFFFFGIFSQIAGKGLIKFLILLYCLCLLYIILYLVISFFSWVYYFIFQEQDQQTNMYSFYVYRIRKILAYIALLLFDIALFVVGKLTGIFLTLYVLYAAARLIGLHLFLLLIFKVFRDCKELGLFDFFDGIVAAIIGFESFGNKLKKIIFATFDFTQTFMEETLGITMPGYTWNLDFFRNLGTILSTVDTPDVSDKVLSLLSENTPIIKINYVKPTPKSEMHNIIAENCKIKHPLVITPDKDTVEALRMTMENAMIRKRCEIDAATPKNQNPIENLENTFVDSSKYMIDGTKSNMKVFTSSLSLDLI